MTRVCVCLRRGGESLWRISPHARTHSRVSQSERSDPFMLLTRHLFSARTRAHTHSETNASKNVFACVCSCWHRVSRVNHLTPVRKNMRTYGGPAENSTPPPPHPPPAVFIWLRSPSTASFYLPIIIPRPASFPGNNSCSQFPANILAFTLQRWWEKYQPGVRLGFFLI